jgi:hypothetical protein
VPGICGISNGSECIDGLTGNLEPILPVITLPIVIADPVSSTGEPVSPEEAAERVVEVLGDTRLAAAEQQDEAEHSADESGRDEPGGTEFTPAGEPLGVLVSADIELAGLGGRPVLLSWSMFQAAGDQRQLFGEWLNENLAFRLEATTDHDATTVDLWIPMPKDPGSYFIRLELATEEAALARADSESFE